MELAVSLFAVFAVVAMLSGLVERLFARRASAGSTTGSSAAWLMGPTVAAGAICSALVVPGLIGACHCAAHGLHHPHLCLRHPDYASMLAVPAGVVVIGWLLLVAPGLARLGQSVWCTQRWCRKLARLPEQTVDSVRFRLIDAPGLGACTVGFFKPWIAVDRGLWLRLDGDERCALLHHEDAHRRRRDPLTLLVLETCAAVTALSRRPGLLPRWREAVERECDRHSARVLASPEAVASALLALERYHGERPELALPLASSANDAALEVRVRALLAEEFSSRPANLTSDVSKVAFVGAAGALALTFVAGDLIHHAAETLLGLLFHHH